MIIFKSIIACILLIALWLGFKFLFSTIRSAESPNYKILSSKGNIEIREYPSMMLASLELSGKQLQVLPEGFKKIANYIFGNNLKKQRIAMTSPVLEIGGDLIWQVAFIMPAKFNSRDLPKPVIPEIKIIKLPAQKYITLRFSGRIKNKNLIEKLNNLEEHIVKNNCTKLGKPIFAFYNPPWTLPFLRRNEIWYQVNDNCLKNDTAVGD